MRRYLAWFGAAFAAMALFLSPLSAQTIATGSPGSLEERSGREIALERIEAMQAEIGKLRAQLREVDEQRGPPSDPGTSEEKSALEPKIVNGVLTGRHATAGALLKTMGERLSRQCSGTLIGSLTFLTAQHCVEDDANAANYRVFLQHAGVFEVERIELAPGYAFPVADLAVLKLKQAVSDIRPMRIRTLAIPDGTEGLIVGFGRSGGDRYDYGLKRVGKIVTAPCTTKYDNSKLICWNFKSPSGTLGSNANTCNVDSGGPLYIYGEERLELAGVTSGGKLDSCLQGDHSYDVNVPVYNAWILEKLGTDTAQPTGPSIVLETGTKVTPEAGRLSATKPDRNFRFPLRTSTKTVRVALHGHDDGDAYDAAQFHWTVTFTPAGAKAPQSCQPVTGQWGFCSFVAKAKGGTVDVTVSRVQGEGEFQITLTELD